MSDNMVVYTSLDADEAEAARRVDTIIDWLLDIEIIAPAEKPDSFLGQYREVRRFAHAFDSAWIPPEVVAGGAAWLFGVEVNKGCRSRAIWTGLRARRVRGAARSCPIRRSAISCSNGTSPGRKPQ